MEPAACGVITILICANCTCPAFLNDKSAASPFFKASFSLLAVLKGKRLGLPPSATFGRGLPDLEQCLSTLEASMHVEIY